MKKIPNIRFKGFEGEWEEKKFGEMVKERKVSNQTIHHQNLLSLSYGKIVRKDINTNKGLLPSSFDTYQIIDKDVIVFRGTDLQNDKKSLRVGISEEEGIITPAYICVECINDDVKPLFLFFQLHFHDVITKIYYRMGDGMRQTLAYEDLKTLPIYVPMDKEQIKVSAILSSFDALISKHEKEVEKMRNIKRALLEKMFPQDGESVPQIRFGEFKEVWEEKKLGKVFVESNERSAIGELLSVTINSGIKRAQDMERKFDTGDLTHYKVVHKNDLAYNTMRMWQGACGTSPYNGIVSPAYTIARPNEGEVTSFYTYMFKTNNLLSTFRIHSQGLTSDTWNLKYPIFSEIKIQAPKPEEQTKIAKLLQTLDNTISARDRQVTLLKNMKRALLEQMFVNE